VSSEWQGTSLFVGSQTHALVLINHIEANLTVARLAVNLAYSAVVGHDAPLNAIIW